MKLIVTDTGTIWNEDNTFLRSYKDIVLIVCLNGKKVSEKYDCFISPYNGEASKERVFSTIEAEVILESVKKSL